MYIHKVEIRNIRSVRKFEMDFEKPAGWHVLIGDNGSGKSSIVRAIAATLIGPDQIAAVLQNWDEWLTHTESSGLIKLNLLYDNSVDKQGKGQPTKDKTILNEFKFIREQKGVKLQTNAHSKTMPPTN